MKLKHTWDGKEISRQPPFGASVVVYRQLNGKVEFLILHRNYQGPDYEGDWAWTPPSGARYPGEKIISCACRELYEETGLVLPLRFVPGGSEDWFVYLAETNLDHKVRLSFEHDRFEWLPLEEATKKCAPEVVWTQFHLAIKELHI